MSSPVISLFFIQILLVLCSASATEFIYNTNFSSTNILLSGNASIDSSILTLTDRPSFSVGRAFYPFKIPTKPYISSSPLPFSTSFIFSIAPFKHALAGHGFVFILSPFTGTTGVSSAQHLGLFNFTNDGNPDNHVFGVEFDVFKNQEFNDINDNHVGVDINSLTSFSSHAAGSWVGKDDRVFEDLKLNDGDNYQVWIDYEDSRINVTMARVGRKRPRRPLISEIVNLSSVLLDEMHVGFCGATGQLVESHKILSWSFSNTNFSIGDALVTSNLPSFLLPKRSVTRSKSFIIGVSIGVFFLTGSASVILVHFLRRKTSNRDEEDTEDWELEYWPHQIRYDDIYAATNGFSDQNVIGFGGNGKVYRGVLQNVEVAVKKIPYESEKGMREFLSEISSLGRLKHRNVVPLRGWCKKERGSLILVYDYMSNGSLDKRIFDAGENKILTWDERIKVLKDVARGLLYLHEGWEVCVLHRDIKASNVLLDKDMNARLGDFGLARLCHHGQLTNTTQVIGTVGYMAPELVQRGKASAHTDVFSFGVLILEVLCGRRPSEQDKRGLVAWVLSLMERGELYDALDEHLKWTRDHDSDEAERVLHLGLLCTLPEPGARPTMRQVMKVLEEERMDLSLIEKLNSALISAVKAGSFSYGIHHPTVEEISRPNLSFTEFCDLESENYGVGKR
ncbi:probable L-type lectin-domain containing receptor kinase VII.2 [Neltuma alba]|uniref:probable L-type lectin-domain containing receptor kinase VII.2 n=1 Tax=Neltuma alba TaxID=207710 RepID=UPI0010A3C6E1|nr:probable L-type lectin-domain containing receptor kinase VII.2 [Prosopis alba]